MVLGRLGQGVAGVTDIRFLERESIALVVRSLPVVGKRVLDYGCGRQPYREIIEGNGGIYSGWDSAMFPASVWEGDDEAPPQGPFDVILCTQVIQYVPRPEGWLRLRMQDLVPGGVIVMTGPTNWPVVENEDLWRFTVRGVGTLLVQAGFDHVAAGQRASVVAEGEEWPLGWWASGTRPE